MIKHVGVVGAGMMGAAVAQAAAMKGMEVAFYDVNGTVLRQAIERIKGNLLREGERNALNAERMAEVVARIHPRTRLVELGSSEIVLEAVIEDLRIKKDLFRHLEADTKPTAILASTTSTLSITAIASATRHPEKVIGLHFVGPVQSAKLVEVVRAEQSSSETIARSVEFSKQLGMTTVGVKDLPGFLFNRVSQVFFDEPIRILAESISDARQIDRIVKGMGGFPTGPFELIDAMGPETLLASRRALYEQTFGEPRHRPHPLLQHVADAGTKFCDRISE